MAINIHYDCEGGSPTHLLPPRGGDGLQGCCFWRLYEVRKEDVGGLLLPLVFRPRGSHADVLEVAEKKAQEVTDGVFGGETMQHGYNYMHANSFTGKLQDTTTCTLQLHARESMSKASWGWWRCDPPQQLLNKFSRAVRDTLGANLRTGNFLLHRLLRGYWLDLGFMAGAMAVGYFWAAVSSSGVAAARASARSSLGRAGRVHRWHTAHAAPSERSSR
jgi:hypothetical protein